MEIETLMILAAMVAVFIVARIKVLFGRKPLPPTRTFHCAKCSAVEEYSPRTITAWRKGIKRLHCKKCHLAWLDGQPGKSPGRASSRAPGGCAPVFLFGLIFLVVIYIVAGKVYYRGNTQVSGKPSAVLESQIVTPNSDGTVHISTTVKS
ncbi:MAG: hypothetical protein LBO79_07940 [Zoogloeaceae bacterium]|jgi:hypothetical protein|nr:hypothetical protein [Zoogloeaceae bacterium]